MGKKLKLLLCFFFKWTPRYEGVLGSGGTAPRIFDLGARCRWLVSFTPRPLYPQGKSPWYPLDRRLGVLQNRSRRSGGEKNSQPPPEIEPRNSNRLVRNVVVIPTELSRLWKEMEGYRIPKQALQYHPEGKSSLGRPMKRWSNEI
jgi:hypothetical protein